MSRAPGKKARGPLRKVVGVDDQAGRVTFVLACGHFEDRKRSDVTRVKTPRPRWPRQIACEGCRALSGDETPGKGVDRG